MAAMNNVIYDIDFSLLLRHYGDHVNLSRLLDTAGNNLLHVASYGGRLPIVKVLIERGVSPLARNNQGWTAIDYARIAGHREIVDILSAGGDTASDASDTVSHGLTLGDTMSHGLPLGNTMSRDARLATLALYRYTKSGWSNKDIEMLIRQHHVESDIPIVDGSKIKDLVEYFEGIKARRQPIILTNVFNDWPAWDEWQKAYLLQRYVHCEYVGPVSSLLV